MNNDTKMECKKIEHIIVDFLMGEISENDAQLVQTHFSECSRCREEFMPMLAMSNVFKNIQQDELPNGFDERFWKKFSALNAHTEISPLQKFLIEIFSTNKRLVFISVIGVLLSFLGPIELLFKNGHWNILPTSILAISLLIITFIIRQSFSLNTLFITRRENV